MGTLQHGPMVEMGGSDGEQCNVQKDQKGGTVKTVLMLVRMV
jgi:hypothetical protein